MASVFVLSTDKGTHSADQWADMVSQLVFPISPDIAQHKMLAAKQCQLNLAQKLTDHFKAVLEHEKMHLEAGAEHLATELSGDTFVEDALKVVYEVTDVTEWKDYMRHMEELVKTELKRNFDSAQHVERLWHAQNNESDAAKAYLTKFGA